MPPPLTYCEQHPSTRNLVGTHVLHVPVPGTPKDFCYT